MADAEDNNGASGGAGENPEEEEEAPVEGMEALALQQPQEDLAQLPRVFLKLETTGVSHPVHITQIKAQRGEHAFPTCFVKPPKPIEPKASEVSGITLVNDQMFFNNDPVDSVDIEVALQQFLQFLGDQPVVLLGHYIRRYGGRHLLREARRCGMIDQLRDAIRGFVDTNVLFRKCAQDLDSNSFESYYGHYLPNAEPFETRNRGEDARALRDIVAAVNISDELLFQCFFTFIELECILSWKPLVDARVITVHIMRKAASNELHFDTVRQAFAEGGEKRAREVLQQPAEDGKPMVTNDQGILDEICRYLRDSPQQ